MPKPHTPSKIARLRAALVLQGRTLDEFARRDCDVSYMTLWRALNGLTQSEMTERVHAKVDALLARHERSYPTAA